MAKCIIIGGGLAGLSTAVYLAENNFQVELIEASPKLGGRTYSFVNKKFNTEFDNGQHLLMGAYNYTLNFLELIKSIDKLTIQKSMMAVYADKSGNKYSLNASKFFYPLNLLSAILNFNCINFKEKYNFIKFVISLPFQNKRKLEKLTIDEWLMKNGQTENSIKSFWEILAVSALNTNIKEASASLFKQMLIKIFFTGNNAARLIIPKVKLSKVFVEPAVQFLSSKRTVISINEKLEKIKFENSIVKEIITNKRSSSDFDFVVLAIPPSQISKLSSNEKLLLTDFNEFESSGIISVNLKLKEKFLNEKFIGLIDSKIHWVFDHGEYVSIVISDANDYLEFSQEKLVELCIKELKMFFKNFDEKMIINSFVIKEKRATIKSIQKFENKRNSYNKNVKNFYFAGDWTDTNLPQTIESAIKSGYKTAQKIIKK